MVKTIYGHSSLLWNKARNEAAVILKDVASKGMQITYGELARKIKSIYFTDEDCEYAIPSLVGKLSVQADSRGQGLISVLVVNKDTRFPGKGLCTLAKDLGRRFKDNEKFCIEETKQVWAEHKSKKRRVK